MERGEVEGFCAIGWTFVKLRKGDWLRDKKINVLFQMALKKHPEIPDVPFIPDLAKTPEDRQVFEFLFTPQEFGRAVLRAARCPACAARSAAPGIRADAEGSGSSSTTPTRQGSRFNMSLATRFRN